MKIYKNVLLLSLVSVCSLVAEKQEDTSVIITHEIIQEHHSFMMYYLDACGYNDIVERAQRIADHLRQEGKFFSQANLDFVFSKMIMDYYGMSLEALLLHVYREVHDIMNQNPSVTISEFIILVKQAGKDFKASLPRATEERAD